MHYDWDFRLFFPYRNAFLSAVWISLKLTFYVSFFGTIIGFAIGLLLTVARLKILIFLNDFIRSIPPLVVILFVYYVPYSQLFNISPPNSFLCALIGLMLIQIAFTADLVRGAVANVSHTPILAARAVAIPEHTIWLYVIWPDIIRQILPSLVAFFIGNLKLSSLASVIGVQDVVYVARAAAGQQFRSLEAWIIVTAIYAVLLTPMTIGFRLIERANWLKRRG
jgi:ABC-type amino acid transport system permease subunit